MVDPIYLTRNSSMHDCRQKVPPHHVRSHSLHIQAAQGFSTPSFSAHTIINLRQSKPVKRCKIVGYHTEEGTAAIHQRAVARAQINAEISLSRTPDLRLARNIPSTIEYE